MTCWNWSVSDNAGRQETTASFLLVFEGLERWEERELDQDRKLGAGSDVACRPRHPRDTPSHTSFVAAITS